MNNQETLNLEKVLTVIDWRSDRDLLGHLTWALDSLAAEYLPLLDFELSPRHVPLCVLWEPETANVNTLIRTLAEQRENLREFVWLPRGQVVSRAPPPRRFVRLRRCLSDSSRAGSTCNCTSARHNGYTSSHSSSSSRNSPTTNGS